ncbi:protein disulfide-isomerase domain [Rhinocladiella mackenziei CBS 650.93]|uniref:protein disulfide-isomerase n=1 Tax=Rhinocladiella mackenziei CBS 650.93 TaxID=1442369 RepID=A0A0D2G145_9EURO|nr:protein disulfide-isomerase domain [Rhinocladiella mackenziei CBS 650.93]KIX08267.1 protein disulfide-isomerase domain [Rhinocladiella mackenziei CBS 650.93]
MVQLRSLLSLTAIALPLVTAASDVVNLIPSNFDKVVFQSNKPALVEFFAPWCGHCKNLAPIYEELATVFAASGDKVTIANVDADKHKDLGKRFGVQGFPTLKWFDGTPGAEPQEYSGGRDLESLTNFIVEKTGFKVKGPKKAPSHVEMLTDTTFEQEVGGDKDVLVAFTAPWCGHCKSLAPTWEKLAADFASEPNVIIAKVDAEAENSKATAQAQGITGYPTIKFFPKGSTEPEPYSGARSEDALVEFVNSKAGTYRVVGGGLNSQAGTIEVIDNVLAKYVTANGLKDVEKATAEVKKVAKDLKDKSVNYYLRAIAKLTGNPEYAMKEQTRLAGLLKKGGLAPEKIDDLQKRSNILSKFLIKDEVKSEL